MASFTTSKDVLMSLFEWWKDPSSAIGVALAPDFEWDDGMLKIDRDDWLGWVRENPPWIDTNVLGVVAAETSAALFFEGIDPISALKYRVAWMLQLEREEVVRLVVAATIVGKAGD